MRIKLNVSETSIGMVKEAYEGLKTRNPDDSLLSKISIEDDGIYADSLFLKKNEDKNHESALGRYYFALRCADGSYYELRV